MNDILELWKHTDCVCFDVDSTVIEEEGIDQLAAFCDKYEEVSDLTNKAMSGGMTFREALHIRLNIIQPSLTQIKHFIRSHPYTLTPGIKTLVEKLHSKSVPVYLISGGFRCIVTPIAQTLGIPQSNVFANRLKFYYTGEYAGFCKREPTSASGGKGVVIGNLKSFHGYKKLVMIGDGATDLEACPPADGFIGYGGNVIREEVKNKAKWYITDFNELTNQLD